MEEEHVSWSSGGVRSMDRCEVTKQQVMHGINNHFGKTFDPYIDDAFVLTAMVDDGAPIEIHCVSTKLEEQYHVLRVGRNRA